MGKNNTRKNMSSMSSVAGLSKYIKTSCNTIIRCPKWAKNNAQDI